MFEQNQAVFDAALTLPEKMRVALVERLWETLSPEAVETLDDKWLEELERRDREFDDGTADPIEWSELRKETESHT